MAVTTEKLTASRADEDRNEAIFKDIFLQNYTRVYGVLFRLTGDRGEAEDLALETFWRLWQHSPAHANNIGGWLYRVATHLGYNALRAARRRTHYEDKAGRRDLPGEAPPDPAEEAERSDDRERVRSVLSRMSERDARLLVLRHSGVSYKELAEALGLSPNSVGTLLARAEQEFERIYTEG